MQAEYYIIANLSNPSADFKSHSRQECENFYAQLKCSAGRVNNYHLEFHPAPIKVEIRAQSLAHALIDASSRSPDSGRNYYEQGAIVRAMNKG